MSSRRFLIIGAHPDDADILFGGTALKLAGAGHVVKFVSMCNGDCGHFDMDRIKLRDRRYLETQASAKIAGLQEYQVFSENHDCELVKEEIFSGSDFSAYIKMPLYSTYLLKITNIV